MPKEKSGWIYFIEGEITKRIKIGFSVDPDKRLKELSTGSAEELSLLAAYPGTIAIEKDIHRQLESSRIKGEWFDNTLDVKEIMGFLYWESQVRICWNNHQGSGLLEIMRRRQNWENRFKLRRMKEEYGSQFKTPLPAVE